MKKLLFTTLLMISVCTLSAYGKKTATVRIGSYNLRMQQLDKDTPDSWDLRHDKCIRSILDNGFDVFGVQEISNVAKEQIASDLKKKYASIFFSPYNQDGNGDKSSGIFYDKKRFKLIEYHYFWISDTPDQVSWNDHYVIGGKPKSFSRGGACVILMDRKSGRKLFFMNNHGILNHEENLKYAPALVELEKRYNPEGLPSFLVGDFNARVESPSHGVWRQHWNDSADGFGERKCTFNGFNPDPKSWDPAKHIDFVYYRNIDAPSAYMVNMTLYEGRCASDHFPIWADFTL